MQEIIWELVKITLFALIDGYVKFERLGKDRKQISIYSEK